MRRIFAILLFLLCASNAWATSSYYQTVTIQTGQVPSTQTDFTVDVVGTITNLKTVGNGGFVQNANGYDVQFYSNADCSTGKLKWATILYTAATGVVHYKVKIASLADGSVFHLCYGDSGISTDQSDPTNAWDSSTAASWSFPDGTTPTFVDPKNANNGTNHSTTAMAGQVDGGLALSGSSQWVDVGDGATIGADIASAATFTISAWVHPTDNANYYFILAKTSSGKPAPYEFRLDNSTGQPTALIGDSADYRTSTATSAPATGAWHFVSFDYTNSSHQFNHYLDGAANGSDTGTPVGTGFGNSAVSALIGTRDDAYAYFKGGLDEIQLDNTARSADWRVVKYNNQSAPSSFYALGAKTCVAACGSANRRTANSPRTGTRTIQ